jgi:hypothetical protein
LMTDCLHFTAFPLSLGSASDKVVTIVILVTILLDRFDRDAARWHRGCTFQIVLYYFLPSIILIIRMYLVMTIC